MEDATSDDEVRIFPFFRHYLTFIRSAPITAKPFVLRRDSWFVGQSRSISSNKTTNLATLFASGLPVKVPFPNTVVCY